MSKAYAICLLVTLLLLAGCQYSSNESSTDATKLVVKGVPSLEELSSEHYGLYRSCFPAVASASLKNEGIEQIIEVDNPNLIRLLDLIAYSQENRLGTMRQGYISEDELREMLSLKGPMLEIVFGDQEGKDHDIRKLVVCGDSYLVFLEDLPTWYQGSILAERCWPYGESVVETVLARGGRVEEWLSYDGWGNSYWMDLLAYSGF